MHKTKAVIVLASILLVVVTVIYVVLRWTILSKNVPGSNMVEVSPYPKKLTQPPDSNTVIDSPFDAALFEAEKKYEQEERPDVIVTNNTPYSNETFDAYTESVTEGSRGYFRVIIYGKNAQTQQVIQQEVRKWLLSLDIPEASIPKLNIEYREVLPTISIDL